MKMKREKTSVPLDLAQPMIGELDLMAKELNVSRRTVIKVLLRQSLDQRAIARRTLASQALIALGGSMPGLKPIRRRRWKGKQLV